MRELIKGSIEYRWRKQQLKWCVAGVSIWLFILLLVIFFSFLVSGIGQQGQSLNESLQLASSIFFSLAAVAVVCFSPLVIFYAYQLLHLFDGCDSAEVCEAVLNKPNTAYFYRGSVYYTVSFNTSKGQYVTLDTKPLWSGGLFSSFTLDEYNNRTVRLAYDEKNGRVIVLGLKNRK